MALSTWLGRNTSTRRGAMGTSSPVLGLRPMRWDFCRTAKVPKEESLTVSPRASASQTSSSMSSTIWADSLRDRPTAWNTASVRSARVRVFVVMKNRLPYRAQSLGGRRFAVNLKGIGETVNRLPADQGGTPGKTAAHGLQKDQIAALDAPV